MRRTLEVDGIDVQVEGEGAETIVMVHGWPDTFRLWDAQVAALGANYRCVRFTLPGFDIDKPRRACSLNQMIDAFKRIIEQASPDGKAVLMVHDWGCVFGYQFALRHPSLVTRIVGVDVGNAGTKEHVRSLGAKDKAMVFAYQAWLAIAWRIGGGLGDRMTRFMARALRSPADPKFIGSQMNYPYHIQGTGSHGSYRDVVSFEPACPMLFVYGQRKPFLFHTQAWADRLAARPGCRVVAMKTGHWVMNKDPVGLNRVVQDWLAG